MYSSGYRWKLSITLISICLYDLSLLQSSCTCSSHPSLQSFSPSQIHSLCRHSWLFGQRSCVGQRGGLVQSTSSEWSLQSAYPSHRRPSDTHWPLAQRYWWAAQASKPGGRQIQTSSDFLRLVNLCFNTSFFPSYRTFPRQTRQRSLSRRHTRRYGECSECRCHSAGDSPPSLSDSSSHQIGPDSHSAHHTPVPLGCISYRERTGTQLRTENDPCTKCFGSSVYMKSHLMYLNPALREKLTHFQLNFFY